MNGNETWMTANVACLALGIGHAAAPGIPLTDAALWFAPFVGTLFGFVSWQYLVSQIKGASEQEEDAVEEIQPTGNKTMPSARVSKPTFLKDTNPAITDPLDGKVYVYKDVCAPTLAAFVRQGREHNYNIRKVQGATLNDGMGTVVTEGLWAKLTDVLNERNLIVKVPRQKIKSVYWTSQILARIHPYPPVAGFAGWWG